MRSKERCVSSLCANWLIAVCHSNLSDTLLVDSYICLKSLSSLEQSIHISASKAAEEPRNPGLALQPPQRNKIASSFAFAFCRCYRPEQGFSPGKLRLLFQREMASLDNASAGSSTKRFHDKSSPSPRVSSMCPST